MKNKFSILLFVLSFLPLILSVVVPTGVIKFVNQYYLFTFPVIILAVIGLIIAFFSFLTLRSKSENKIFPVLAIIIALSPGLVFGTLTGVWKNKIQWIDELTAKEQQFIKDNYVFNFIISPCADSDPQSGWCKPVKNSVEIKDLKTGSIIQKIKLKDINANVYSYKEYPNFEYEDLNFDGRKDLAIMYEQSGTYGLTYYDVYLYNKNTEKFELSKDLSDLLVGHLGFYTTNIGGKNVIIVSDKSGCCVHYTTRYEVINNVPEKVYQETTEGGVFDKIVIGELINGVWQETISAQIKDAFEGHQNAGWIYSNQKYNFETVYPFDTFYLHDGSFDTNNIEQGSMEWSDHFVNPILISKEGIPSDMALVISATDTPWQQGYLGNSPESRELNLKEYAKQMTAPSSRGPIEINNYSYGKIYEVIIYPNPKKVQHVYFFPNTLFTFNYASADAEKAFADIEKIMIEYAMPGQSG